MPISFDEVVLRVLGEDAFMDLNPDTIFNFDFSSWYPLPGCIPEITKQMYDRVYDYIDSASDIKQGGFIIKDAPFIKKHVLYILVRSGNKDYNPNKMEDTIAGVPDERWILLLNKFILSGLMLLPQNTPED